MADGFDEADEMLDDSPPDQEVDDLCPAAPLPVPHRVLWVDQHFGYCVRCKAGFHAGD